MSEQSSHDEPVLHRAPWSAARALAYDSATALPHHWIPLAEAVGETLAEDVRAEHPVPHYTSATVDGWAVRGPGPWRILRGDLEQLDPRVAWARTEEPQRLPVTELAEGTAAPIDAGGLAPDGTSAVLPTPWGQEQGDELRVSAEAPHGLGRPGEHLRSAGCEAEAGDLLLRSGSRLTPGHVALAAVTGLDMLPVQRRPRVTLLLTGDEVEESGVPAPGRVRDAFGPQLPQFVHLLGGQVDAVHRVGDDREQMLEGLSGTLTGADSVLDARAHLIITTGGTGHAASDHLRPALADMEAELIVDELDVRPGHPALLARLPQEGGAYVLGLPGTPLAAMTALMLLGAPLLAGLGGGELPPLATVGLTRPLPASNTVQVVPGLTFVAGAAVSGSTITELAEGDISLDDGLPRAVALAHSSSHQLRGFSQANVLLMIPPDGVRPGEPVAALPLPWL